MTREGIPKQLHTPEMPPVKTPAGASEYITISVAEYHFLAKAAAWLEAVLRADEYNPKPAVDAVRCAVQDMKKLEGCF